MVQETFKRASENYKKKLDKESGERERERKQPLVIVMY